MDVWLYGLVFVASLTLLYISGEWIVVNLSKFARDLGVKEFVLAFFVMATAASLPNLFVGITSALRGIPELSLGDVFGNNIVAMTLAVSAGVFFSKSGFVSARGNTIRLSLLFTFISAILPVLLILDGVLSRVDGAILVALFVFYSYWLLSRRGRFSREYGDSHPQQNKRSFATGFRETLMITGAVLLLILAVMGMVNSISFFAIYFKIPLVVMGLLVVGLGNALPEVHFSIASARRGDTELIMGNLMGSVIVPATLILGIVSLIEPIKISNALFIAENRIFLILAAALFFVFSATHKKINRLEGFVLALVYFIFLFWTIKAGAI